MRACARSMRVHTAVTESKATRATCRDLDFCPISEVPEVIADGHTEDVAAAGGVPRRLSHPHRAGLFRLGPCRIDLRPGLRRNLVLRAADRGACLVRVPGDPG